MDINDENICRICLDTISPKQSIFDKCRETFLPEIILLITGLQILENDNLPKYCCYNCANQLHLVSEIKEKCFNSDRILRLAKKDKNFKAQAGIDKNLNTTEEIWRQIVESPSEGLCTSQDPSELQKELEEFLADMDEHFGNSSKLSTDYEPSNEFKECSLNSMEEQSTDENNIPSKCEFCSKKSKTKAYERHKHCQNIQQHKVTSKCPICFKVFHYKSNLKRHFSVHRNKIAEMLCTKCNDKFSEINEFYEHLKLHKIIDIEDIGDIGDLNGSDEVEKQDEYVLECKICNNHRSTSLTLYLQHMREKHQIDDTRPFTCKICDLKFCSKQGMYRHIDNIHENNRRNLRNRNKNCLCPTCGKAFYTNFHLQVHIRCHTGEKPYHCGKCDKSFTQASGLRMHLLTHSGIKPFACPVPECGKAFTQYGHVKDHLLTHSEEKNHICTVCGHSFRVKGNLTAHMLVHSGKRPFSCGHCDKGFIQKTKLRAHVIKYHQPEYSDEDEEDEELQYLGQSNSKICEVQRVST